MSASSIRTGGTRGHKFPMEVGTTNWFIGCIIIGGKAVCREKGCKTYCVSDVLEKIVLEQY